MLAFVELAFYLMIAYTVFCISLTCKTYIKELEKSKKKDS